MEFKSLTNIESSFRRIRLMLAVFTGCCALVTGYALWSSYRFAERQREKIYVIPQPQQSHNCNKKPVTHEK